jgi:hypothetical protein
MKKIKNFNDSIDDLFSNIDLPTDEEIKQHTISYITSERNKEPEFRKKVSNGLKKLFGSLEERFFNYVKKEKNGCWICSKKTIMHDGIEYKSKEVSLKLHNIKQTAECITTKCGNIKCVNPKHLICVSREDTALLTVKNRKNISRGNGHPSKLSVSDVNNIKKMYNKLLKERNGKHKGIATIIHKNYSDVTLSAICQIIKQINLVDSK